MSLFSDEVKKRCRLDDLVVGEIEKLPEPEGCLVDEIPILEMPEILPVDGDDGSDGIDGFDAQDAADGADGRDGRDGCDATDGFDAQDAADGVDGSDGQDGCDAIDGFDAQDAADGVDGKDGDDGDDGLDGYDAQDAADGVDGKDGGDGDDGLDGYDAQDAADGTDGRDGQDGCDATDGFDAQDAADGTDGRDGRDGCDAIDGFDAQDAADGADGRDGRDGKDGCDAIDGSDSQDGIDGLDGQNLTGVCIKAVNISGRHLRFGSAVGVLAPALNKPPVDPPPGGGMAAILMESERYFYFEDRTYYVGMPHDDLKLGILMESSDPNEIACVTLTGIVRAAVHVRDLDHDTVTFTPGTTDLESTDDAGPLSYLVRPDSTGRQWCDLIFGSGTCEGGGAGITSEKGTIQEPCHRPLFRNVEPNPWYAVPTPYALSVDTNKPSINTACCLGTIKIPGKTYRPIEATYWGGEPYVADGGVMKFRERGEPMKDDDGNPLYLKKRIPRTSSDMLVVRSGSDTSGMIQWGYTDGSAFDNTRVLPPKPMQQQYGWCSKVFNGKALWETTTKTGENEAQYNYDFALCRNLDWSEALIEGDYLEFQERNVDLEIDRIGSDGQPLRGDNNKIIKETVKFTYYEAVPPASYLTSVEGQAKIVLKIVTPDWGGQVPGSGPPETFTIQTAVNNTQLQPPDAPKFETVYLKLTNQAIPDYQKTQGICNDCTVPRVRGVFLRRDAQGRGYPMLFEVPTLRVGGAIRSRKINCYYKTENDNCSPQGTQPEMKLLRSNAWRLILDPNTCAITSTELNDKTSTGG